MVNCFQEKYAKYYDLIYKDKDYKKECDYLEAIFSKFMKKHPKTILDLGCGTGGHAIPLAKRDYKVTGIDASEAMINIAYEKSKKDNQKIKFYVGRIQDFKLNKKFDIVISMFSAMDYLTDYFDLERSLFNIKSHLKKSSLFIFDFWNGTAVMNDFSPIKTKVISNDDILIKRESITKLNKEKQICTIIFKCFLYKRNKLLDKTEEVHQVRYYFLKDMSNILKDNGFEILGMFPFLTFRKKIKRSDWNITVIARLTRED